MKKIILSLFCLLFSISINAQTTTPYSEFNIGFSSGIVPFFPGTSVLYGATTKYNSGIILDYEGGIAFPSIVTGKLGVGLSINENQFTLGVRPWPSATYLQVKLNRPNKRSDIILSAERMMWSNDLFIQSAIFTIGWRFDNTNYRGMRNK